MVAAAALAAVLLLMLVSAGSARGATAVPQGFTDRLVAQMPNPTSMARAPDGRLFVARRGARCG